MFKQSNPLNTFTIIPQFKFFHKKKNVFINILFSGKLCFVWYNKTLFDWIYG